MWVNLERRREWRAVMRSKTGLIEAGNGRPRIEKLSIKIPRSFVIDGCDAFTVPYS
jgi:hypothetical protein